MIKGLSFPKRKAAGLDIKVPGPGAESVQVKRVGIIACIGFTVGVLWPRLAGVQIVPPPPFEELPTASSASAKKSAGAVPVASGSPTLSKIQGVARGTKSPDTSRISIRSVEVTSCRTRAGRVEQECGELALDSIASHRIKALKDCRGVADVRGTLSLGLEIDFESGKVARVLRGKSTTLPSSSAKLLSACAEKEFESAAFDRVEHSHSSYTVFYIVEFSAPVQTDGEPGSDESDEKVASATAASGRATVGWQVALIRAEPEDGEVVARLLGGTNVMVTARKGDWYKVKYDAKGEEGWVFKAAIGL